MFYADDVLILIFLRYDYASISYFLDMIEAGDLKRGGPLEGLDRSLLVEGGNRIIIGCNTFESIDTTYHNICLALFLLFLEHGFLLFGVAVEFEPFKPLPNFLQM